MASEEFSTTVTLDDRDYEVEGNLEQIGWGPDISCPNCDSAENATYDTKIFDRLTVSIWNTKNGRKISSISNLGIVILAEANRVLERTAGVKRHCHACGIDF